VEPDPVPSPIVLGAGNVKATDISETDGPREDLEADIKCPEELPLPKGITRSPIKGAHKKTNRCNRSLEGGMIPRLRRPNRWQGARFAICSRIKGKQALGTFSTR